MRASDAAALLVKLFNAAGWKVHQPDALADADEPAMVVRKQKSSYAVKVKAAAEGRADRLIPLWSQAYLEAIGAAGGHQPSLVVVAAPRITRRTAEQVLKFAEEFGPDAAAGVIDFQGLRSFHGPLLEQLNAPGDEPPSAAPGVRTDSVDLFSDLNQWMLKVLLAPEIPERLTAAPRGQFRNASQLARAANVSVMSAFRLVHQLQREGYLHESTPYLKLVRREELFHRWQAASTRRCREVPVKLLLGSEPLEEARRMGSSGRACLALFAAAEALQLGFVHGVPPYVYVERLAPTNITAWKRFVPAERQEAPDIILRQAFAPQSVFRGSVRVDGVPVCDVLQVWLDVSAHPSRGLEQAELIRQRVLAPVIKGD